MFFLFEVFFLTLCPQLELVHQSLQVHNSLLPMLPDSSTCTTTSCRYSTPNSRFLDSSFHFSAVSPLLKGNHPTTRTPSATTLLGTNLSQSSYSFPNCSGWYLLGPTTKCLDLSSWLNTFLLQKS
ncbi:unnamed protein product [Amoebophrya sp. A25]|nr:unnamed protein product [Amoebophrya sp. A25]|eukprot:GSA25T00017127001.1